MNPVTTGNLAAVDRGLQARGRLRAGLVHQRLGAAELVGRDDQFGRVDGLRRLAARGDRRGDAAAPRASPRCPKWRRAAAASARAPSRGRSRASRTGRAAVAARRAPRHGAPGRVPISASATILWRSKSSCRILGSHWPVEAWRAAPISESVTLLIADVTTTTWWPLRRYRRRAARLVRCARRTLQRFRRISLR